MERRFIFEPRTKLATNLPARLERSRRGITQGRLCRRLEVLPLHLQRPGLTARFVAALTCRPPDTTPLPFVLETDAGSRNAPLRRQQNWIATPEAITICARRRRLQERCFGILKEQMGERAMRDGGQPTRSAINIPPLWPLNNSRGASTDSWTNKLSMQTVPSVIRPAE